MPNRTPVAVVTADLLGSRRYSRKARAELDRTIRQSFAARRLGGALRQFKPAATGFHITVGDEFQFVTDDFAHVVPFITHLRARLARLPLQPRPAFRAAIGIGSVTLVRSVNAYEQDGPAFVRARDGLDALKALTRGRGQRTIVATGQPARDREFSAVLALMDHVQARWTTAQFEAVDLTLQGAILLEAAAKLGIRHQNVSKRLRAAGWYEFNQAQDLVSAWLLTLKGVK